MINAFIQIKTDAKKNFIKIAREILKIKGISEVHTVTGDYDIYAVLRAKNHEEIASIVTDKVHEISGIFDTNTVIALNSYADYNFSEIWATEIS